MTLLQLKYIVKVAAAGTISEAAKQLYIAMLAHRNSGR